MNGQVDFGRIDSVIFDLDGTLWDTCAICALAWNKVLAKHALSFSGFKALFRDFECWGNAGNSKAENLADIVRRNALRHPVMVGDMESDLAAARACGIPFLCVRYEFGEVSDRDASVDSFGELARSFMESTK